MSQGPHHAIKSRVRPLLMKAAAAVRRAAARALVKLVPGLSFILEEPGIAWGLLASTCSTSEIDPLAKLYSPYSVVNCKVGRYTYIGQNTRMSETTVGSFCSLGPNLSCGRGVHPTNGISTSPMFYSTKAQNGFALSKLDKCAERKPIVIGNDVFIGMNVTILDGATIGDGAVVGSGAVVVGDVPPYAIAVGVPARVIRYRFDPDVVERLRSIRWWDFELDRLVDVERDFWDVEGFVRKHEAGPEGRLATEARQ